MERGYITKGIGGFYYVKCADALLECKAKGIFRKRGLSPVAGDWVQVENGNVIAEIEPRRNVFVRPPIANLDILFIIASTVQPSPSTLVIDKLSAIAVDKDVEPVLIITKADLAQADTLQAHYAQSGLRVLVHAPGQEEVLDEMREMIRGKLCAFCGNSGVGKSTLMNALLPDLGRETGDISLKLGRGRHTTREVEIFEAFGGRLADTPGFASLDTLRACAIPLENLEFAFPEFRPYLGKCRFTGCAHRAEAGCAIRQALADGKISQSRYDSYAALYDEAKQVNAWERP